MSPNLELQEKIDKLTVYCKATDCKVLMTVAELENHEVKCPVLIKQELNRPKTVNVSDYNQLKYACI